MRKCLILLCLLVAASSSAAPAWRWVDANGQVHYSDRPVPGATRVELAGAQTFNSPPRAPARPLPGSSSNGPGTADVPGRYEAVNIVSPRQQETLWNIGATLNVQLEIEPALQPNHQIDVFLDGERKNLGATSPSFALPDVFRGVHTLQAVIVDQAGQEVARSPVTTFMVQQTSILNPNNPNARRP